MLRIPFAHLITISGLDSIVASWIHDHARKGAGTEYQILDSALDASVQLLAPNRCAGAHTAAILANYSRL
jgi:hypothetical protein